MDSRRKLEILNGNLLWKLSLITALTTSGCGNETITPSQVQDMGENNSGELGLTSGLTSGISVGMDSQSSKPYCDPKKMLLASGL